ncbi:MAG: transposase [Armatimonadetes bacterium]|nr:transposase [Armatimonadota bacterium]
MGRAIIKTEAEAAVQMMQQLKERSVTAPPPALVTDGNGAYREALVATYGTVPPYGGRGRPPVHPQPAADWQYVQVVQEREGNRVVGMSVKVVYGDPDLTPAALGARTAYVERTNLTRRQMTGRLVRKTLSFSKQVGALRDAACWEDGVYTLTRPLKSLRQEGRQGQVRWQRRTPAMAAGLTDHIWTVKELLSMVVAPTINSI